MKMMLKLERNEIQEQLPYELICMTRESSIWDTGKRKRRWAQEFSDSERKATTEIFREAHDWTLKTGAPAEKVMSLARYQLWQKLGIFCASL